MSSVSLVLARARRIVGSAAGVAARCIIRSRCSRAGHGRVDPVATACPDVWGGGRCARRRPVEAARAGAGPPGDRLAAPPTRLDRGLGLDLDPRPGGARRTEEAPPHGAADDQLVVGRDGLEPRRRVPDRDRHGRLGAVAAGTRSASVARPAARREHRRTGGPEPGRAGRRGCTPGRRAPRRRVPCRGLRRVVWPGRARPSCRTGGGTGGGTGGACGRRPWWDLLMRRGPMGLAQSGRCRGEVGRPTYRRDATVQRVTRTRETRTGQLGVSAGGAALGDVGEAGIGAAIAVEQLAGLGRGCRRAPRGRRGRTRAAGGAPGSADLAALRPSSAIASSSRPVGERAGGDDAPSVTSSADGDAAASSSHSSLDPLPSLLGPVAVHEDGVLLDRVGELDERLELLGAGPVVADPVLGEAEELAHARRVGDRRRAPGGGAGASPRSRSWAYASAAAMTSPSRYSPHGGRRAGGPRSRRPRAPGHGADGRPAVVARGAPPSGRPCERAASALLGPSALHRAAARRPPRASRSSRRDARARAPAAAPKGPNPALTLRGRGSCPAAGACLRPRRPEDPRAALRAGAPTRSRPATRRRAATRARAANGSRRAPRPRRSVRGPARRPAGRVARHARPGRADPGPRPDSAAPRSTAWALGRLSVRRRAGSARGASPSLEKSRRRPTLPGGLPPSTIGAGGLHFRVRNGNGCFPAAIATGNLSM